MPPVLTQGRCCWKPTKLALYLSVCYIAHKISSAMLSQRVPVSGFQGLPQMVLQLQFGDLLVRLLCLAEPVKQHPVNALTYTSIGLLATRELTGWKPSYLLDNTKRDFQLMQKYSRCAGVTMDLFECWSVTVKGGTCPPSLFTSCSEQLPLKVCAILSVLCCANGMQEARKKLTSSQRTGRANPVVQYLQYIKSH